MVDMRDLMVDVSGPVDADLRWGVERRLEFIEFRLYWEGRLNRADLTSTFGISVPQASADLTRYQELAPGNLRYDKSAKTYLATSAFRPVVLKPDADAYLNRLRSVADGVLDADRSWLLRAPEFETVPTLRRSADPERLRAIVRAIREGQALHVRYQSMSRPEPTWRWISPHALGFDGFRWHARALCHEDRTYKDFLLPRMLEVGEPGDGRAVPEEDRRWHTTVIFQIAPHPKLTVSQRRAIELDYDMIGGRLDLEVRAAFAYYVRKRLGLDRSPETLSPTDQQIILLNPDEVEQMVTRITGC